MTLDEPACIDLEVTADARYTLWLIVGDRRQFIGRGPHRGIASSWCLHHYTVKLPAGDCRLVALVESGTGTPGTTPAAQIAVEPGFRLRGLPCGVVAVDTGVADWRVTPADGIELRFPADVPNSRLAGGEQWIDIRRFYASRDASPDAWSAAVKLNDRAARTLKPTPLPEMSRAPWRGGRVRFVCRADVDSTPAVHDEAAAQAWQSWWTGERPEVTVAPHTAVQALLDLDDYVCADVSIETNRGAGATIDVAWAESMVQSGEPSRWVKGNRDEVWGKRFVGRTDTFVFDGRVRTAETFHWRAGRYLRLTVRTADEPITLRRFTLTETRFPLLWAELPRLDHDAALDAAVPVMRRAMETCAHEHFMDCPYYEQLQYVGDTRLQALVTYALCGDDRLGQRAIRLFAAAQRPDGWLASRLPCTQDQLIPGFCLAWIGMLYDLAMWRGHRAFIAEMLPTAREVVAAFLRHSNADGLPAGLPGWLFVDWVPGWPDGTPGETRDEPDAIHTLWLIETLRRMCELETWAGDPTHAEPYRQAADRLADTTRRVFWCERRQLFADTERRDAFSEHAQALAVLAGLATGTDGRNLLQTVLADRQVSRTTIYFRHYLLEAMANACLGPEASAQLEHWRDLPSRGLKTTPEMPEPTRSDNHAWGAHPLYHLVASVLGVRPACFGFEAVTVRPLPGPWGRVRGDVCHPRGRLRADFDFNSWNGDASGRLYIDPAIGVQTVRTPPRIQLVTLGEPS
ncbi:MAG: alpha-L-rhamnosidase [Planctomycetota bacterium]